MSLVPLLEFLKQSQLGTAKAVFIHVYDSEEEAVAYSYGADSSQAKAYQDKQAKAAKVAADAAVKAQKLKDALAAQSNAAVAARAKEDDVRRKEDAAKKLADDIKIVSAFAPHEVVVGDSSPSNFDGSHTVFNPSSASSEGSVDPSRVHVIDNADNHPPSFKPVR